MNGAVEVINSRLPERADLNGSIRYREVHSRRPGLATRLRGARAEPLPISDEVRNRSVVYHQDVPSDRQFYGRWGEAVRPEAHDERLARDLAAGARPDAATSVETSTAPRRYLPRLPQQTRSRTASAYPWDP